jgi:hypothetical protein
MAFFDSKGSSPFTPNQPVSPNLFTGRQEQITRLLERGVYQVSIGKPAYFFIEGDYGIGKSSLALFSQILAERERRFFPINCSLAGAKSVEDVCRIVLEASLRQLEKRETLLKPFEKLIKAAGDVEVNVFGFAKIKFDHEKTTRLTQEFSSINGLLGYLESYYRQLGSEWNGLYLVLDELNGITENPDFSKFLKGLSDQYVTNDYQLPLVLALCGVPERRQEMLRKHPSIERMFDVINLPLLSFDDTKTFYENAFQEAGYQLDEYNAERMAFYATPGYPKVIHLLGQEVYWADTDKIIDFVDIRLGLDSAVKEFGVKYLEKQVFESIRTPEYLSILNKAAHLVLKSKNLPWLAFDRLELDKQLDEDEKKKLRNGLSKLQDKNVIKSLSTKNQFAFASALVWQYILLRSENQME